MLANGYRMCIWSHGCDQRLLSRAISRESQDRLYFGVEWEVLGVLHCDGAAVGVELVVSLFVSLELLGNAKNILLEELVASISTTPFSSASILNPARTDSAKDCLTASC